MIIHVVYCLTKKVDAKKEDFKQIIEPKGLKKKVLEVAHDTMLAKHLGVKKTEDRVLINFHWAATNRYAVGSVVEWLKRRAYDQHDLGSKRTRAILMCSWERNFNGTFLCLVVLASSSKLQ